MRRDVSIPIPLPIPATSGSAARRRRALRLAALLGACLALACGELEPGGVLENGGSLVSGGFRLTLQGDNNLVLYGPTRAVWASDTVGVTPYPLDLINQASDGHVFLYDPEGRVWPPWGTGATEPDSTFAVDPGGRIVVRKNSTVLWAAGPEMATQQSPAENKELAWYFIETFHAGWDDAGQRACLDSLWTAESGWNQHAVNPSSGACGIPQSLPCDKMGLWGFHYAVSYNANPYPQIRWGLEYIAGRYGTPCDAWAFHQANNWY